MKKKQVQFGFVPSKIESNHYVLGGGMVPKIILQPNRNWKDYLPKWESQINGYETYGCTVFGTLNAIETYFNRLSPGQYDFAERFNYILAGIQPPGSDPHWVCEIVRKYGVIPQEELPMPGTYKEFIQPNPMTVDKLRIGQDWKAKYSFQHEWVFTNTPSKENRIALIREALQYSPVAVSVTAWYEDNGVFVDEGQPNNHWTLCYGIDDDGGLLIFDSYALVQDGVNTNAFKKLSPDHQIMMAKRFYISASNKEEEYSWIQKFINTILEVIGITQKSISELPKVDKPVSPEPKEAYNEVKESLKENMIEKWARSIDKWEGSTFGNNPGNMKYSPLIASWGGKKGQIAKDGGYFAKFDTYDQGFKALCNFLELGCKNELKSYKQARTLQKFMTIYAGNPPQGYINGIAKDLNVSLDTDISTFL